MLPIEKIDCIIWRFIKISPGREEWSSLIKRPALDVTTLFDTVRTVLDEVREQGDTAVKAYEEKFDKCAPFFPSSLGRGDAGSGCLGR